MERTRMRSRCFFILIVLTMVGCTNRVQFPSQTPSSKIVVHTENFYLWGLIGEASYEVYEDCPSGLVYQVYAHTSPLQIVWNVLTLGAISPRTIEVTCSGKSVGEMMDSTKEMETQSVPRSSTKTKQFLDDMPTSTDPTNPSPMKNPMKPPSSSPKIFDLN